MDRRQQRGVTLVELMTVMGIVAVLAALSYPSYIKFTQRGNRTDATRTLTTLAQALERCYSSQNFNYTNCVGAAPAPVPAVSTTPNGYYTVTAAATPTDYTLQAVPAAGSTQVSDADCQTFLVGGSTGQSAKNGGGVVNTRACWGTN